MIWKQPQLCKIYEALGAIGDDRITISTNSNEAKVFSSSRNKFYTVTWNDSLSQMMSNDNSAFWVGELSYPMIAVLMLKEKISYEEDLTKKLSGIAWKDINQMFNNDFDKTVEFVLEDLRNKGMRTDTIEADINRIAEKIAEMKFEHFGEKQKPPEGY